MPTTACPQRSGSRLENGISDTPATMCTRHYVVAAAAVSGCLSSAANPGPIGLGPGYVEGRNASQILC